MRHLGNIYLYIVLLVITIFLIAISIANSIYFKQVNEDHSQNLSSSQSQQLVILNIVLIILLAICFIAFGYMLYDPFNKAIIESKLNIKLDNYDKEFNEKLMIAETLQQERNKKKQTIKEMKTTIKVDNEINSNLKKENKKLKNKVKSLKEEINLTPIPTEDEFNPELNSELQKAVLNPTSIFYDDNSDKEVENINLTSIDDDFNEALNRELQFANINPTSIFHEDIENNHLTDNVILNRDNRLFDEIINNFIEDLENENFEVNYTKFYPTEEQPLDEILNEMPATDFEDEQKEEVSYDYGVNIPKENTDTKRGYESFNPHSNSFDETVVAPSNKYTPYIPYFLKNVFRS